MGLKACRDIVETVAHFSSLLPSSLNRQCEFNITMATALRKSINSCFCKMDGTSGVNELILLLWQQCKRVSVRPTDWTHAAVHVRAALRYVRAQPQPSSPAMAALHHQHANIAGQILLLSRQEVVT